MKNALKVLLACALVSSVNATTFTETSPTSQGANPAGVTKVGGIVLDAVGSNGARLVSQLSASSLYVGYAGSNPQAIGTQGGLTPALLGLLGGGFSELAIRVTLFDGDTAAGDFDQNDNLFYINGISLGNWSSVQAQNTDSTGVSAGSFSGGGFRNETLDTGWFYVTNAATLSALYTSIFSAGSASYSLSDSDWGDNYYDFTQGVSGSLIDTELPPVVTVPDSGITLLFLASGLSALVAFKRRVA